MFVLLMGTGRTDLVWHAFLNDRKAGFKALYEKYYDALLAYCISKLKQLDIAENAVAEIFIKLYTFERPEEVEQPENWIFTIARNYCLGYLTKEKNRNQINGQLFKSMSQAEGAQADQKLDEEIIEQQIRAQLNEINQEIWWLDTQGFSNKEIAEETGIHEKTIANRKSEIRKQIRSVYLRINREE